MLKPRYIKHPSWRVYKAVADCNLELSDFCLKDFDVYNNSIEVIDDKSAKVFLYIPCTTNDDVTDELCKALTVPDYKDTTYCIADCLSLFMNVKGRQLIEVMLLNGRSVSDICEVMNCSDVFAMTYKSLFFDTTVFKTLPDKLVYMVEGICGEDARAKHIAEEKGEEYFKLKYSVAPDKLSIDGVLAETLKVSYESMHKNVICDDVNSQEVSQGWANLVLKLATEIRKKGVDESAIDRLILNLTTAPVPVKSFDDLN